MVTKSPPALILYGLNEHGEPRAAHFDELQAKSALKLAEKMGLEVLKVTNDEHSALATQLEPGKLFLSGDGSVPKAPTEVYAKIVAAASAADGSSSGSSAAAEVEKGRIGRPDEAAPASQPEPEAVQATASPGEPNAARTPQPKNPEQRVVIAGYPHGWEIIEVGHLVLAQESSEEGWWEAIVLEREDDLFTLKWRDYPKLPKFVRHRTMLGLMAPLG